ncbi:MAG TPA: AAA family ATPase [Acidocella sp.]|nr:AAA family ATPase [Acidocella sp.]
MPDSRTVTERLPRQQESAPPAPAYSPSFAKPIAARTPATKREAFVGFARDAASATMLHEALEEYLPHNNQIHVVDFRASLAILAAMTTPEVILIDLSGEDQPINAMTELADAVEPGTVVLAIGEIQNISIYRTITKGMGVSEYLAKPLTRAAVERSFLPLIGKQQTEPAALRGGRLVAVTGARGGVGTSTIATNLAWHISAGLHRHTVLLDGELHNGTVALNLNLNVNNALGAALAAPERVDPLFIERSMSTAGERLHVLAGLEALSKDLDNKPGSANLLIQILRARYNFVVADAGASLSTLARDLLFIAQQRVIVLDPSMISIRNLEKLLTLPGGPSQSPRTMVVLNKAGTPGGLSQTYMEQTMGLRFDAVIPDLPRIVPRSTQLGTPAAALRGPFRVAIGTLANALGATIVTGED